jgi:hypothetical protein
MVGEVTDAQETKEHFWESNQRSNHYKSRIETAQTRKRMKHPLTTLYGKQHWPQCMLFFQVLYGISIKHASFNRWVGPCCWLTCKNIGNHSHLARFSTGEI